MTPEGKIEAYLHARVEAAGGFWRRVKWIGRNNAPDDVIGFLGISAVFVEVKRPGERPTKPQLREHEEMRDAGMLVTWVSTEQEVDALLQIFERELKNGTGIYTARLSARIDHAHLRPTSVRSVHADGRGKDSVHLVGVGIPVTCRGRVPRAGAGPAACGAHNLAGGSAEMDAPGAPKGGGDGRKLRKTVSRTKVRG